SSMSSETEHPDDGLLPEPDPSQSAQQYLQRSARERRQGWRRFVPPCLCSIGFHLFFLPLVMIVTITFADELLPYSSWQTEKYGERKEKDQDLTMEIEIETDFVVSRIEAIPKDAADQSQTGGPEQQDNGEELRMRPQPVQRDQPEPIIFPFVN